MKNVRIGYLSTAYHTSFILMGTDSIRKRMNTQTEWKLFPTGPEMIKAFMRDELDIGYIGLPPAMVGISKGLTIRCVAGGHMEGTILTANKDFKTFDELGNIQETLTQFRGKTIGTPTRGSIHDVIIRSLLENYHLQDNVTVKNFNWADQILEAMEDNEVDCGVGTPPLAVLAHHLLSAKLILPPRLMWPHNPSYGIVATMKMIQHSPQSLENFLLLHEEASNMIRTKPAEAAQVTAKTLGVVDRDFVLEVYSVSPKYCASLSMEYMNSALAFVPFLEKMRYISSPIKAENVFHTEFVKRIHPQPPHYEDAGNLG